MNGKILRFGFDYVVIRQEVYGYCFVLPVGLLLTVQQGYLSAALGVQGIQFRPLDRLVFRFLKQYRHDPVHFFLRDKVGRIALSIIVRASDAPCFSAITLICTSPAFQENRIMDGFVDGCRRTTDAVR